MARARTQYLRQEICFWRQNDYCLVRKGLYSIISFLHGRKELVQKDVREIVHERAMELSSSLYPDVFGLGSHCGSDKFN